MHAVQCSDIARAADGIPSDAHSLDLLLVSSLELHLVPIKITGLRHRIHGTQLRLQILRELGLLASGRIRPLVIDLIIWISINLGIVLQSRSGQSRCVAVALESPFRSLSITIVIVGIIYVLGVKA